MDRTCYTYLIGWSQLNKWYYGVRYGKNCSPDDLWKSYFTSSKYVHQLRLSMGEPDIIEIRKTFKNAKLALKWENTVLKRLKVKSNNDKWLNKSDNIFPYVVNNDFNVSECTRQKISKALKGRVSNRKGVKMSNEQREKIKTALRGNTNAKHSKRSEEQLIKIREARQGNKNGMFGKQHSAETKRKFSESRKNKPLGPQTREHSEKISNALKGLKRSEETIEKYKEREKNRKIFYCAICDRHIKGEGQLSLHNRSIAHLAKLELN